MNDPGKFEQCPAWAVELYDDYLNGSADIKWVDETLINYQQTASGKIRAIWEDDNGFVHHREFEDDDTFNRWLTDIDPLVEACSI